MAKINVDLLIAAANTTVAIAAGAEATLLDSKVGALVCGFNLASAAFMGAKAWKASQAVSTPGPQTPKVSDGSGFVGGFGNPMI
jgi:hypothetical protein